MSVSHFSLLRLLADGEFHSGERLARTLGLSRTGVWNQIRRIEALGLRVFRVRGRGYRLARSIDLLDRETLAARLRRTCPTLSIEMMDECSSTNSILAERAVRGAPSGTVLVCEHQSAGRGRRGNVWHSAIGGSLVFSLLRRFSRGPEALTGLSLAVAVGAARALEKLGVTGMQVKWPNDLYCMERKLGGILIEISGNIAGPSAAVIGVGLNVRLNAALRERIGQPVTDVASVSDAPPSRVELLVELLEAIDNVLAQFAREGFAPFREEWLRRHAWQGRRVAVSIADRRVAEGEVLGIAEDGALMLASPSGVERFHSGELTLRRA
jgi:BirA family transcriptional regulator, biotin operon repressor / biotin---[acetyl-CoA-carboxylase] ligase